MAKAPNKRALLDELAAKLRQDLDVLGRAHRAAIEGATHEQAKPENDKDTRALEQSYLARGQAARVEALTRGLAEVVELSREPAARVMLGALVTVDDDGEERTLLVASEGGGLTLGAGVQVVTPRSPLGQALLGKTAGDACEVRLAGKLREFVVLRVR